MTAVHPYRDPAYAAAFAMPTIDVPEWGARVLRRSIPGSDWFDVIGCYPLTPFRERADVGGGLERLRRSGAVSVLVIPDPLNAPDEAELAAAFSLCAAFKTHYVIDRSLPLDRLGSTHRSNVRRAQSRCDLKPIQLRHHLEEWTSTYAGLVQTKNIMGFANFDAGYFRALAEMPALATFGAFQDDALIAAALWLRSGEQAYYHLGSSLPAGYKAQAMYGLVAMAIDYFDGCRLLNLGGSAGSLDAVDDGLAFFKRGFSNATRVAKLCGAILDAGRYAALTVGLPETSYFPAYRAPVDRSGRN